MTLKTRLRELAARSERVVEFALSLGTAKKALRGLRETGKNPARFRPSVGMTPAYIPADTPDSAIKAAGGMYEGIQKLSPHSVIVPKKYVSNVVSPVEASLHEHGHAADKLIGRSNQARISALGKLNKIDWQNDYAQGEKLGGKIMRLTLHQEKRANRNVLNQIAKHGTPEEVLEWKKTANRQIKTGYRNPIYQNLVLSTGAESLAQKKALLKQTPFLRKKYSQLCAKLRLRCLSGIDAEFKEFSVAWARRLKGLSPAARRRLDALQPQTRQVGGKLGQGADFRVYESFTPGRGRTVTKTLVPDALKDRDEVMAGVKKAWGDVEASPAGKVAALPTGWHKSGYVQDRMVEVAGRRPRPRAKGEGADSIPYPAGRRRFAKDSFIAKVSPFPMHPNSEWAQMPKGALDSSLGIEGGAGGILAGKSFIKAQNIMLDPRKRRLVLTDPLGWQSSSAQIGALTPGPGVR